MCNDKKRLMAIASRIRRGNRERHQAIDDWVHQIHMGDVREILKRMPSKSVRLIFFSPPYFGKRDYDTTEE